MRESALELDKITARKRQSLENRGLFQNIRSQLGSHGSEHKGEQLAIAEEEVAREKDRVPAKGTQVISPTAYQNIAVRDRASALLSAAYRDSGFQYLSFREKKSESQSTKLYEVVKTASHSFEAFSTLVVISDTRA